MLKIVDSSAISNLSVFGASRQISGRHFHQTARYAMRLWVSFALNKIAAADPAKIRTSLSKVVTAYTVVRTAAVGSRTNLKSRKTSRVKAADQWRGTLAAKIVGMLNYKGARRMDRSQFYRTVGKWVRGRVFGARIHRAGMGPAMDATADAGRVKGDRRRLPRYRRQPGSYEQRLKADTADILVENFASAFGPRAKGIAGIAPEAFSSSAAEVDRLLGIYAERNLREAARSAGYTARAA
jgi:hypothetical protein